MSASYPILGWGQHTDQIRPNSITTGDRSATLGHSAPLPTFAAAMKGGLHRAITLKALLSAVLLLPGGLVFAQDHGHDHATERPGAAAVNETPAHGAEKFNPGKMIMGHIADAHSWHLWGHTSVPLPVILWTNAGMEFFSSARLMDEHHEPVPYKGAHHTYLLQGKKIVALDAAGKADTAAGIIDLSITKNVASLLMSVALLLLIFISVARAYQRRPSQAPRGLQGFMEPVILFIRDNVARNSIGEKHFAKYVPYLLTLFFFIWINNLIGLIPIFPFGANVTGNIAIPLVLAVISFVIVTVAANWHYWRHMLAMPGVPWPVLIILTPIEVMGHFVRPTVLMIRLFANLMAGHIVLLVFFSLIFIAGAASITGGFVASVPAVAFTIFVNCLELLVAALQAYVFVLLTAIYIGMAVAEPHHAQGEHH